MHGPLFGCMCEGKVGETNMPHFELWKEEKRIIVTNTVMGFMNCPYHPKAKHWRKEHGAGRLGCSGLLTTVSLYLHSFASRFVGQTDLKPGHNSV